MGLKDQLLERDRRKALNAKADEVGLAALLGESDAQNSQYHQNKDLRTAFPVLSSEYGDSLAEQQRMQAELGSLQKAQQFYPDFKQRQQQAAIDQMEGSALKNATVAALNVVPEAMRIIGQGGQLLTGGLLGQDLENLGTGVSQDIYRDYATPKLMAQSKLLAEGPNKLDAIIANPGAAATIAAPSLIASATPSTLLGSAAGKTALRMGLGAQRAGDVAGDVANLSNVFMNASQGFAEKNAEGMNPLQNLGGALVGSAINRALGSKLGGGAEGSLARAMSGTGAGTVGKALLTAPAKGALDELADNLSIETSKAVSENRTPEIGKTVEDSLIDMFAGALLGGAGDVSSAMQTNKQANEIKADPVAKAIYDLEQEEKAKQQAPAVEAKAQPEPTVQAPVQSEQPEVQALDEAKPVLSALDKLQEKYEAGKPQEQTVDNKVGSTEAPVVTEPEAEVKAEDQAPRFSIAGEVGAAHLDEAEGDWKRTKQKAVAEEMERNGKDARSVLVATGWQRGADGKWRYEMVDGKPKVESVPEYGQYRLGDIYDDDTLFTAYPKLKDFNVVFDDSDEESGGFYVPNSNLIFVNPKGLRDWTHSSLSQQIEMNERLVEKFKDKNPEFAKKVEDYLAKLREQEKQMNAEEVDRLGSILVHEAQHYIQEVEGFAKGTSLDASLSEELLNATIHLRNRKRRSKQWARYQELAKAANSSDLGAAVAALSEAMALRNKGIVKDILDEEAVLVAEWGRIAPKAKKEIAEYIRADKSSPDLLAKVDSIYPEGMETYRKHGGEVESRNAQLRKDWSRQKRRQTLLEKTEDVPRNEQIIKFSRNPRTGKMDIKLSIAWHGSPHIFEVFLTDHIGTGEGAQAHGWGLYFAKDRDVAASYRKRLSRNQGGEDYEIYIGKREASEFYNWVESQAIRSKSTTEARKWYDRLAVVEDLLAFEDASEVEARWEQYGEDAYTKEAYDWFNKEVKPKLKQPGRLFKLEIPDEDLMLDEQKQFKDQPKHVQDALNRVVDNLIAEGVVDDSFLDFIQDESGWGIYWSIGQKYEAKYGEDFDALKAASLALNAEGIPGITYMGEEDGRCYVVFDDKAVKVLNYYSKNKPQESTSGSTVDDVTESLESDKDIGEAFATLRDSGEVNVVQSIEDLPEEIRSQIDDAKKSWIHYDGDGPDRTSRVSHESYPENKDGVVATVSGNEEIPDGDIVVELGVARGHHKGSWILHGIDNAKRNESAPEGKRYRVPESKNEASIFDALLNDAHEGLNGDLDAYIQYKPYFRYVFVTNNADEAKRRAYICEYKNGVHVIRTQTPTNHLDDKIVENWKSVGVAHLGRYTPPHSANDEPTVVARQEKPNRVLSRLGQQIVHIDDSNLDYVRKGKNVLPVLKLSDNGDIQGLYDPRTGKAYLIADALTDETAKPVFLHEMGVHSAYGKNPLKLESQMKLARNMVNNGYAQGNDIAVRVKQRLFDANEIDSMDDPIPMEAAEECLSYLVEETASTDDRGPFRKWFDSLMTAIKQWLRNHGINVNLNEWDFVEMAKGNVVAMARESGKDMSVSYSKKGNGGSKPTPPTGNSSKSGRFLERDEMGRFRLKAGRKLIEGLGYTVSAVDSFLSTAYKFQNAPQALRMQIREMKAKIEKAGMDATEMAKLMKEMPAEERKLISDVIEQELSTGVNPPDHVLQIATKITQIMDEQAQELVSLGMLSKDSYERYRGKYLPRFYLRADDKEAIGFFGKIFGGRARMRGVAGTHLKGRGIFKEVPAKAAHNFIKLGWEVRDPNYEYVNGKVQPKQGKIDGVDETGMVVIWRDYTPLERAEMGEIRDASYRFAVGYMQTQRDLAVGRLFKAIASNPEWTSSTAREGFVYLPKNEVPDAGGVLKYGALAGKYVDEVVLSHISHIEDIPDGLVRAFRQGMAFWKEGKTAMNPVSHMNNTVGNFVAAHLAGVNMWDAKTYSKALHSLRTADASFKEAQDAGLFTGSFSQEEFVKSLPEDLKHLAAQEETGFKKFGDTLMRVFTWGLRDKLRNAYEFEDAFFKMAIYQKARESGMDPQHAVDYAHKFVFVYDTLPEGARKLRNSLFPFFAWTYQAVPMLATAAVCYPWRFFAPAAILFALNKAFFLAAAGDDDDTWAERWKKASQLEDAERTLLPKYMQGSTLFMTPKFLRLGIDEATGLPQYINLSHMIPGGNFLDFENQMGGVPLPEILTPNHPLLNAFMAYIGNQDMFSGFDMTKETDSTGEKVQKYAEYTWKQLTPAIAIGNYHWGRLMDGVAGATGVTMPIDRTGVNRHGEVMPLDVAIKNMVGLKVRTFDPDNEMNRQMRGHAYNQRMIQSEKRSAYRRARAGALPIDSYQEFAKKSDEKVRKVREEMGEVRKARATIKDLSGK